MKTTMRKWMVCLLSLCTLLALCACGGKKEPSTDDPDSQKTPAEIVEDVSPAGDPVGQTSDTEESEGPVPQDSDGLKAVMHEAADKIANAKSISYDQEIHMVIPIEGLSPLDLSTTMSGVTIREPLQLHNTMFDKSGNTLLELIAIQDSDYLNVYVGVNGGDAMTWRRTSVSVDDQESVQEQTASNDISDNYITGLENADSLKEIGSETVNGKMATRYDGVFHGKDLGNVLTQDYMKVLGINPDQLNQDASVSIWVYEDGLPAKIDIDLGDVLAQTLAMDEDTSGVEGATFRIVLTITGVDTIGEIVIPQEALDAEIYLPNSD